MPSRQDQLHSYQFAVQRMVAALVMRETDPAQSPFRRAAGATLASILIAAIAIAAVAVYGVFVGGGNTRWRTDNALVVEQETGARFVYVNGKLHPVLNYASALLISGSANAVRVKRKSIEGVPRGNPLGIPDAPDPLPTRQSLAGYPWTVCSADPPGATPVRSVLRIGVPPSGGKPLGADALLVTHPESGVHLLWNKRRHLISDADVVRSALGWASQPTVPVAQALINSIPAGADLGLIDIPGRGEDFSFIDGAQVGEVFVVQAQGGVGEQYAVALRAGLAAITEVQVRLLLADPATGEEIGQSEPTELALSDFVAIPKLDDLAPPDAAPPAEIPALAPSDGAVCAVATDDGGVSEVRAGAQFPDIGAAMPAGGRARDGSVLVDFVMVEPGRGAVVESVSAPGAPGGTLSVVTDLGRRYAVPGADVLSSLGLAVKPVRVPANIVALLPAGPALDPKVARNPAGQS